MRHVTVAMIPGRIGSTRLKMKNLALLAGRPLISYAIEAAIDASVFDRIVVDADHEIFDPIARKYGAEFYLRPRELGSSTTKSDDVVYDFMAKHPADIVAWVNPTSPLQPASEVRRVVEHFIAEGLDSLITVKEERLHALVGGRPLNFEPAGQFAQTQDLAPIQLCVYSVMIWRTATFMPAFRQDGYALLCGKIGYVPVSRLASIIIKTPEDLEFAASYLAGMRQCSADHVSYASGVAQPPSGGS